MTDFPALAAHARQHNWPETQTRTTSQAALDAWEQYEAIPRNKDVPFETDEQDAFTTGYDLGRDSRDAEIATEIRLGNLIAWLTRDGRRPTKEQQQLIDESLGL